MSQAQKQISIDKFKAWSDTKAHALDYYLQFINLKTQTLKKETVRKAAGLGDKVLKKDGNPDVQELFYAFEKTIILKLREAGLLPLPVSDTSSAKTPSNKLNKSAPSEFDQNARNNAFNARRVAELEKENFDLKNEIKRLEARLEGVQQDNQCNRETITLLSEVGVMPR